MNSLLHKGREYIAMATVGVLFFGTPHRGSKDASWGRIIAELGSYSGLNSYDGIIRDLEEESTNQIDLLHDFSVWLRRTSVESVCFFELKETDYGQKIGFSGIRRKIVVTETSACIDGYAKISLDVDHLHLNQFKGPDDASYKKVRPEIKRMVDGAPAKILRRMNPRPVVYNDEQIRSTAKFREKLKCIQALLLTDADVILENLRRTKGDRVEGTCEWVLVNAQFTRWLNAGESQLLRLTGGPGIGKTMIAAFLVDELKTRVQHCESDLFAFFFCDNKDERQRTATAVLRSLLVQLLRQHPSFFSYIQPEYDNYGEEKFKDVFCLTFDALWMVFEAILRSPMKRSIFIIIDALDECEEESKSKLVTMFRKFFDPNSQNNTRKPNSLAQSVKVIIVHRPEPGIEGGFPREPEPLRVDSGLINCDLSKFIKEKTVKLQQDLDLDSETSNQICDALERKAEGTFLWVSLVLGEMDKRDTQGNLTELLDKLPSGLPEIFELILRKIKSTHGREASFIVRIILVACRPLKVDELAMICVLGLSAYDKTTLPTDRDLNKWRHGYRCCGAFLKLDEERQTIHLVHQSAKDFLGHLSGYNDLAEFYSEVSVSNFDMLKICWKYMRIKEGEEMIPKEKGGGCATDDIFSYATDEWRNHAMAAYPAWVDKPGMENSVLNKLPLLRDAWLLSAVKAGQYAVVEQLLHRGASVGSKEKEVWGTPVWIATSFGHEKIVELLLNKGVEVDSKDRNKETLLMLACKRCHEKVVELLLNRGANVHFKDTASNTALIWAARASSGTIVKLLLDRGAKVNVKNGTNRTPLIWAAKEGNEEVGRLLLDHGAHVNFKAKNGSTPLSTATASGHKGFARLLIHHGAKPGQKQQKWLGDDKISS